VSPWCIRAYALSGNVSSVTTPSPVPARTAGTEEGTPDHGSYNRLVQFLFVCTANICRSPMAAALFAEQVGRLTDSVEVSSAGLLDAARAVPPEVLEVMVPYGVDLSQHRSRRLTAEMLEGSDLIIGMGRRHVQEVVLLDPPCWPQAFKLKELVRRGQANGPRRPDQGIRSWIDAAHGTRTRADLTLRSSLEEVADPYGGSRAGYAATADELAGLTAQLVAMLWPESADEASRVPDLPAERDVR
jgi:protein-tyrosine phosphatase